MTRSWAIVVVLTLVAIGCSGDPGSEDLVVTGRVVATTGVDSLESFVVEVDGGSSRLFVPSAEFDRSLEDLRAFVVSGSPVDVTYERGGDGPDVAVQLTRSR